MVLWEERNLLVSSDVYELLSEIPDKGIIAESCLPNITACMCTIDEHPRPNFASAPVCIQSCTTADQFKHVVLKC